MQELLVMQPWIPFVYLAWTLPWKGVALWRAARLNDRWWFVALFVLQTLAILEILYIFVFSKRKTAQAISTL
jgi:hypothetical protein